MAGTWHVWWVAMGVVRQGTGTVKVPASRPAATFSRLSPESHTSPTSQPRVTYRSGVGSGDDRHTLLSPDLWAADGKLLTTTSSGYLLQLAINGETFDRFISCLQSYKPLQIHPPPLYTINCFFLVFFFPNFSLAIEIKYYGL